MDITEDSAITQEVVINSEKIIESVITSNITQSVVIFSRLDLELTWSNV